MMLQRPTHKPNFGRSMPLNVLLGGEQELARVEHEMPRECIVHLGDTASMFNVKTNNLPIVKVQFGTGGVNSEMRLLVPVRCSVLHVVAQVVIVRAVLIQDEGIDPAVNARFSAHVGYGTPRRGEQTEVLRLGVNDFLEYRLLPFTTHVSLSALSTQAPHYKWLNVTDQAVDALGTSVNGYPIPFGAFADEFPQVQPIPIAERYCNSLQLHTQVLTDIRITQHYTL